MWNLKFPQCGIHVEFSGFHANSTLIPCFLHVVEHVSFFQCPFNMSMLCHRFSNERLGGGGGGGALNHLPLLLCKSVFFGRQFCFPGLQHEGQVIFSDF